MNIEQELAGGSEAKQSLGEAVPVPASVFPCEVPTVSLSSKTWGSTWDTESAHLGWGCGSSVQAIGLHLEGEWCGEGTTEWDEKEPEPSTQRSPLGLQVETLMFKEMMEFFWGPQSPPSDRSARLPCQLSTSDVTHTQLSPWLMASTALTHIRLSARA